MTYEELLLQIDGAGWTRSANHLDDLILKEAPPEYYCFWRFIWRETFGWKRTAKRLSLREISEGAHINKNTASRAAWFFHMCQLIHYTPGQRNQNNSLFEVLPLGLPDVKALSKLFHVLACVLADEKRLRSHNKDQRFDNQEFTAKCAEVWQALGGQVQVSNAA